MDKRRKLSWGIFFGTGLWIGGIFILFQIFGDSKLIALLALLGWFVLVVCTFKYYALKKKEHKKDTD